MNDSGSDLGEAWRDSDYDDSQPEWRTGSGLFGFSTDPGLYPAPIQTPLEPGRTTYYFRTRFTWTNDP